MKKYIVTEGTTNGHVELGSESCMFDTFAEAIEFYGNIDLPHLFDVEVSCQPSSSCLRNESWYKELQSCTVDEDGNIDEYGDIEEYEEYGLSDWQSDNDK